MAAAFRITSVVILLVGATAALDALALTDGQMVDGYVSRHGMNYYDFEMPAGSHEDVVFEVVPKLVGTDMDLYVDTRQYPNRTSYLWKSTHWGGDIVNIRHTDSHFCLSPCSYHIGVYGYTAGNYTIRAASSAVVNTIRVGSPVRDIIDEAGEYEYFKVNIYQEMPNENVSISVSAFSGETDFYVSMYAKYPNASEFNWRAVGLGNDTLVIGYNDPVFKTCGTTCTLHIGVLGVQPSDFSVLVTLSSQPALLVDGVTTIGIVEPLGYAYYYAAVPSDFNSDIQFTLTMYWGNADIYVRKNALPTVKPGESDWSSTHDGNDEIVIRHTETKFCAGCTYYVGVYATHHTHFRLLARTTNATVELMIGTPFGPINLPANNTDYYRLRMTRNDVNVTFTVAPFSGETDFFISTIHQHPGPNQCEWYHVGASMSGPKNESITIGYDDPLGCTRKSNCIYYIAVFAVINSQYVITASTEQVPVVLSDGQSLSAYVKPYEWKYYYLPVSYVHKDVSFYLTPTYGDPDLYVDTCWKPTSWKWKSRRGSGVDQITVRRNHTAGFCSHCNYYIGVRGYPSTSYGAGYKIMGATDQAMVTLHLGSIQEGEFLEHVGDVEYYRVGISEPRTVNLTFDVTIQSGSADLYASTTVPRPNATAATWKVERVSGLTIGADDPNFCPQWHAGQTCWVYVTMRAREVGTLFSIVASTQDIPILLISGVSVSGHVVTGKTRVYKLYIPDEHEKVVLQAVMTFGDADFYVSTSPNVDRHHYIWSSTAGGHYEYLTIHSGDPQKPLCANCWLYIGVYGYRHAHYTVTAKLGSDETTLNLGLPYMDEISHPGHWAYYLFRVPAPPINMTVDVTVTSGSDNDVTFYVSKTAQFPNATMNDWAVSGSQGPHLFVPSSDPKACPGECYYHIGLVAAKPVAYTIVASINREHKTLIPGLPQSGELKAHEYQYYEFSVKNLEEHNGIYITVTPLGGALYLYVNNRDNGEPTRDNNPMWSSEKSGTNRIQKFFGDKGWCRSCTYIIGVYDPYWWWQRRYSIMAYTEHATLKLRTGHPETENIPAGSYDYFSYQVVNSKPTHNLEIQATMIAGDVELYVASDPSCSCKTANSTVKPNANDYIWKGTHRVEIPMSDTKYCGTCVYYIGVSALGGIPAVVNLVASDSGHVTLVSGTPTQGVVTAGSYDYFTYWNDEKNSLQISLTSVLGEADVFVSTTNNMPGTHDNMWFATHTALDTGEALVIPATDKHYCTGCNYYIGILGGGEQTTSFALTLASGEAHSTLLDHVYMQGSVSANQYQRYEAFVSNDTGTLMLRAESCEGQVEIYASRTVADVSADPKKHTWGPGTGTAGIAEITIPGQTGGYYIAVRGAGGAAASFKVIYETGGDSRPVPGNAGNLIVEAVEQSSVDLGFERFVGDSGQGAYTAYFAKSASSTSMANLWTPCAAAKIGTAVVATPGSGNHVVAKINGLTSNTTYTLNVIAVDTKTGMKAAYTEVSVATKGAGGGGGPNIPVYVWVLGAFGVAALFGLPSGYFVYKRQRMKAPQIELGAVKEDEASAALVYKAYGDGDEEKTGVRRARKYERLLGEDQDEQRDVEAEGGGAGEVTTYSPPEAQTEGRAQSPLQPAGDLTSTGV